MHPRYRAFISYSQSDKEEVKKLQKWLETYRVPRSIAAEGLARNRRLGRFFLDDEDMSAASDISEQVQAAIRDSKSLIVVCSPRSAKSVWVEAEIQHFRRTNRGEQIFAIVLNGVPNSSDPETECFPPSFRRHFSDATDEMPIEPLAVNLVEEGRERSYTRLAAGLIGVRFDDLWQRERRRQRVQAAVASSLMLVGVSLTIVASISGWAALSGNADVSALRSSLFASEARRLINRSQGPTSILLALHADPSASRVPMRRLFTGEAGHPLARAALVSAVANDRHARIYHTDGGWVQSVALSQDGQLLASAVDGAGIYVWDLATNELVLNVRRDGHHFESLLFGPNRTSVLALRSDGVLGSVDN